MAIPERRLDARGGLIQGDALSPLLFCSHCLHLEFYDQSMQDYQTYQGRAHIMYIYVCMCICICICVCMYVHKRPIQSDLPRTLQIPRKPLSLVSFKSNMLLYAKPLYIFFFEIFCIVQGNTLNFLGQTILIDKVVFSVPILIYLPITRKVSHACLHYSVHFHSFFHFQLYLLHNLLN